MAAWVVTDAIVLPFCKLGITGSIIVIMDLNPKTERRAFILNCRKRGWKAEPFVTFLEAANGSYYRYHYEREEIDSWPNWDPLKWLDIGKPQIFYVQQMWTVHTKSSTSTLSATSRCHLFTVLGATERSPGADSQNFTYKFAYWSQTSISLRLVPASCIDSGEY